jgi:hypothetical protein
MNRERLALGILLAATFAVRAVYPDQPIVENYVGRQIPTAMVARNLERGSGFGKPQLDTGPFPNLFLVEPPIYAQVTAWVKQAFGFVWEPSGRLVSAFGTTLAAWGLYGLARRREGVAVGLLGLASFCAFPVMVRYGRAFQPDALMLGCVLAGLRGWDEFEASGKLRWGVFGGFVLAMGIALKATNAWVLLPFFATTWRRNPLWRAGVAFAMLLPDILWYGHVWRTLADSSGSLAASANAGLWAESVNLANWANPALLEVLGRNLFFRSFTPVGFVLAVFGLVATGKLDRFWSTWLAGCGLAILVFASKWHHAYYWMALAPVAAVGVGRGLTKLWGMGSCGRVAAGIVGSIFLALCVVQAASTYRTPREWSGLRRAAEVVAAATPVDGEHFVVASEALLYYADRRGFRLEFDPGAAARAAEEWGEPLPASSNPLALLEFYRVQAGRAEPGTGLPFKGGIISVAADVGLASADPARAAWRAAVRGLPGVTILLDQPDAFVARLP